MGGKCGKVKGKHTQSRNNFMIAKCQSENKQHQYQQQPSKQQLIEDVKQRQQTHQNRINNNNNGYNHE